MINWIKETIGLTPPGERRKRPSVRLCTRCGKKEGQTRSCQRCNVVRLSRSPEEREYGLRNYDQKVSAANAAAEEIIDTLRFASPSVSAELRNALLLVLANDFKKANSGKWKGNVATGYIAGDVLGSFLSN